ncbi:MAG TPA: hypothetical protein VG847_03925, partial [Chitinophagaceae bacterium]|nr:hypothetical protein [Chitinophagaceae bacterium]
MQLQIEKANVLKAYKEADKETRKLIANLFGEKNLYENIIDRIQTWDDIIEISGCSPDEFNFRKGETDDELAYRQAKLISEVYNEGDSLDPMNTNQWKYFPWHKIDKTSGSGFSFLGCGHWNATTLVGVRLCFKNANHAID